MLYGLTMLIAAMQGGTGVSAPTPPTIAMPPVDGRVDALSKTAYAALKTIRASGNGAIAEQGSLLIASAIMADKVIDAGERDLLVEFTNPAIRAIIISAANTPANEPKLFFGTLSGKARLVLVDLLYPPVDMEKAWANGADGWRALVTRYRGGSPVDLEIAGFIRQKLKEKWTLSNSGNANRPFTQQLSLLYKYSNELGNDADAGKQLLYYSAAQLDYFEKGMIPDFLYSWLKLR